MEDFTSSLSAKVQKMWEATQMSASRFSYHVDTLDSEQISNHGLELFWLVVFCSLFVISAMMNRFGRYLSCICGSVMFYYAVGKLDLPWFSAVTFGKMPFFLKFDNVPLYLMVSLPVITFVADFIARETFRAKLIMSGVISAVFHLVACFPLSLLAAIQGHAMVADSVFVTVAKQIAFSLAAFQFFATTAIQFVDICFCKTKRFAFLHTLLSSAAVCGSVVLLGYLYENQIFSSLMKPWIENKIAPLVLADLIPIGIAFVVLLLVLIGLTAGSARYPSAVGSMLFVLIGLNVSAVLYFLSPLKLLAGYTTPTLFVASPVGKGVVLTVAFTGLVVTLLPLFNGSPIAESPSAMYEEAMKKQQKEKKVKKEVAVKEEKEAEATVVAEPKKETHDYYLRSRKNKPEVTPTKSKPKKK